LLTTYYGALRDGRLSRLSYLGHSLVLMLFFLLFGVAVVYAIGLAEHLVGGDLAEAQEKIRSAMGIPALLLCGSVALGVIFAQFNIAAKRVRDMGLPGWSVAIGSFVLLVLLSTQDQIGAANLISAVYSLSLLFVPGGTFATNSYEH
jgi:uncharacterized membrane protein YhaH (DUF805 family)